MTTLTNFEVVNSNLPKGTLGDGAFFIGSNNLSNKEMPIGNTSSWIVYQLKDVYAICKRYWDVATYKWDVHNGKIDSISLVVKLRTHRLFPTKYQPSSI